MNRAFATIVVALVVATWAAYLWLKGFDLTWELLGPFSIAVGVLTAAGLAFRRWVWRWPFAHLLTGTPYLAGTWVGKLKSSYIHAGESTPRAAIDVVWVISQTIDEISVRQFSGESHSDTVAASIAAEQGDRFTLATVYMNQPEHELQQGRSRIHFGATRMAVSGPSRKPVSLAGTYWTTRATSGTMDISFVSRVKVDSLRAALKLQRDARGRVSKQTNPRES